MKDNGVAFEVQDSDNLMLKMIKYSYYQEPKWCAQAYDSEDTFDITF